MRFCCSLSRLIGICWGFFREVLPGIMEGVGTGGEDGEDGEGGADGVGKVVRESTFGEAEVEDLTAW